MTLILMSLEFWRNHLKLLHTVDETKYINGVEPHKKYDFPMALSCASYMITSCYFIMKSKYYMASVFSMAFVTSILSDSIYHKNIKLDILDRFVATINFINSIIFSSRFFWLTRPNINWVPLFTLHINIMYRAIYHLNKSRQHKIGSEEWRKKHIKWHWYSSMIPILSSAFSMLYTGEIDVNYFLNSIGCSMLGVNVLCGMSWYVLRAGGDGIEFSRVSLVEEVCEVCEDREEKIETNNGNKI